MRYLVGTIVFGFFLFAQAESLPGVSYTIHNHYVSPRALSMGNAFVAIADDYNAVLYNPAGLARREEGDLNMYLDFHFAQNFVTFAKDIQESSKTEGTENDKRDAMVATIEKVYGESFGGRVSAPNAMWARPGWGMAVIPMDVSIEATVHKAFGPTVNTTVYGDSTVAGAYAENVEDFFLPGEFSWGITGKFVNRAYFSKGINFIELAADPNLVKSSDVKEGYTVDGDLGFLWSPYIPEDGVFSLLNYTKPTFGLVVRNVLETGFGSSLKLVNKEPNTIGQPEKMYRVIDIGSRWEYPNFWLFGGRGALDIKNIMHPAWTPKKGLHLGFEFDWTMFSWWRGQYRVGLNQGYWTAGLSALFAVFNLDVLSYAEDVGPASSPQENRVYELRLSLNF